MNDISNETRKPKALIPLREFGHRLGGRCTKTIERMLQRGTPGMPAVIWVGRQKFFEEQAADAFISETISRGIPPGEKPFEPAGAAAMRIAEKAARQKSKPKSARRKTALAPDRTMSALRRVLK